MKVVTVEQMRTIERATDAIGTSYSQMMENAGRGVAEVLMDRMAVNGRSVVILVGPGNNGGDGLVAGRYLAQAGALVTFYLFKPRPADDVNLERIQDMDLHIETAAEDEGLNSLHRMVTMTDILIDALLGTGAGRPIEGSLAEILKCCAHALDENRQKRFEEVNWRHCSPANLSFQSSDFPLVVAVDCPSGLNCDTGAIDPLSLPADLTVTFAAPKQGQFIFPGAAAIGELVVVDIGSPEDLDVAKTIQTELVTANLVKGLFPPRPLDGHKGTFGKAMIVAGSVNYTGAAVLAGEAAYRAGAGLVTMALPGVIHAPVSARLAEATYLLLPHDLGVIDENGRETGRI